MIFFLFHKNCGHTYAVLRLGLFSTALAMLRVSPLLFLFVSLAFADPRHAFDPRCPPAVAFDSGNSRGCSSRCEYQTTPLSGGNATPAGCAAACCGDWSCLSFRFTPATPPASLLNLTGGFTNHDSLRGATGLLMLQQGDGTGAGGLRCTSADPARSFWTSCEGRRTGPGGALFLVFDGEARNNRTGVASANPDGTVNITLSRLPIDPPGFTQVFAGLANSPPTCTFMGDVPPVGSGAPAPSGTVTGVRALLPPAPAPFPLSTYITSAALNRTAWMGVDGDEFPVTWSADGNQYSGAGDNTQPSPGCNKSYNSPASVFRVAGPPPPLNPAYPEGAFSLVGDPFAVSNTTFAKERCSAWGHGVGNIKSSGMLEVGGVLYWAVSCFNYGDDSDFNRQRYGPAWITRSLDGGNTWDDTGAPVFAGRLSAPRLIQFGQAFSKSRDGLVYVLFPYAAGNASFFECNDAVLLGRVAQGAVMDRGAYEFFMGLDGSGAPQWSTDDGLAQDVLRWGLHTSVQQVNWHDQLGRFIMPSWVWLSADGAPRPDHSPTLGPGSRTARQRSMLMLLEAEVPWGPWRMFFQDANWQYSDGSSGAYTPVVPPAWAEGEDKSFWIVSTQCCGNPQFPPTNHCE